VSRAQSRIIARAAERRDSLAGAGTPAYRVVHAEADGAPGLTVDRFADVLVASFYQAMEEKPWVDALAERLRPRAIYVKRRPREARVEATTRREALAPEVPAWGEPLETTVCSEKGLRFLIRPGQGLSVGLYLDMRDTRAWVREASRGRSVLNLFAYTCGFGVAALAGDAKTVLNVDLSRRVLDWGVENAKLNGQAAERQQTTAADAQEWLRRAHHRAALFDLVVLDPPSFSTTRGRVFSAARDYAQLTAAVARVVAPGGLLVACCNLAQLSASKLTRQVTQGLADAGRQGKSVRILGASPVDFPPFQGTEPALKVLIYALS
jgi:23S rRNA (cytosine1962-C5)-methyltransferase